MTTWLAIIVLRSIDAAAERASLLLDRWGPTIKFGKQMTRAEVDEHITRLIDESTAPLLEKYDRRVQELIAATDDARQAAAEHRAAAVSLGRQQGRYDALVAQGHCRAEAMRDLFLRRN